MKKLKFGKKAEQKTENTELEIEINLLLKNDVIHTEKVKENVKTFKYKKQTYNVNTDYKYLYPSKKNFIPMLFYREGQKDPICFQNANEGIPSRALHLLWNHTLYRVLVALEGDKTNKIIILMLIVNAVVFGIRLYFTYGSG